MVMCACVCKWLCVCVNIVLYKDVYIVGPPRAFLMRCHHAVRVGGCVNDPVTCVLKMMLSYRTSWNLRHVTMGSGVGGCVNVPGTCVLKMMLRYRTLSGKSVTPATPNEFFAALKRLLKATWLPNAQKKRFLLNTWVLECVKTRKSYVPNDMYASPL